jgi:hypothetical protein
MPGTIVFDPFLDLLASIHADCLTFSLLVAAGLVCVPLDVEARPQRELVTINLHTSTWQVTHLLYNIIYTILSL